MLTSILIISVIILIVLVLVFIMIGNDKGDKDHEVLDAKIERNYDDQARLYGLIDERSDCRQKEILSKIKFLVVNKEINDVRKELRHLKDDIFMSNNGISKFSCYKCSKELGFFNISDSAKYKAPLFCSLECCKK